MQPFSYDDEANERWEKEIDVWLAIDLVIMAIEERFDVAILFSQDRDFRPALRYVRDHTDARVDIAGWMFTGPHSFLNLEGQSLRRHVLSQADYRSVVDETDYRRKPKHDGRRKRRR